jgi:hypothetical protein
MHKDLWGCNLFVAGEGLTQVDIGIQPSPYSLDTLAGGIVVRDQIQLCSVIRASDTILRIGHPEVLDLGSIGF